MSLIPFQWWCVGAILYRERQFIKNEMSDLVHWSKYDNLPITSIYEHLGLNISSSSYIEQNGCILMSREQTFMGIHDGFAS